MSLRQVSWPGTLLAILRTDPITPFSFEEEIGFDRPHGAAGVERKIVYVLLLPEALQGVDQAPRLLDFVRAGEERRFADESVDQEPLVGFGQVLIEAAAVEK